MTFHALLFCPDEKTSRVTTQILNELEFTVEPSTEPFAAVKKLMAQHFDAIVVDCDNEQNASLIFKSARNSNSNQSSLAVAVVEGQAGVANAFRIGANLVLTKPINVEQAKSTLRVARGLLRKGGDSAKAASATPPAPSAPLAPSKKSGVPQARSAAPNPPMPATAPVQTVSKPVFAPFRSPRAEPLAVQEPTVDPERVLAIEEPAPIPQPQEITLLEVAEQHESSIVPPQPAAKPRVTQPAASKENPWQPVSKRAAETAAKLAPELSPTTASVQPPTASLNVGKTLITSSATGPSGAATAVAPAKAVPRSPAKAIDDHKSAPAAARVLEGPSNAIAPAESAVAVSTPAAPSFTALESSPGDASAGGSGKTGILVAVAVLALAAAGYFGYTKVYAPRQAATKLAGPAQPPAAPLATLPSTQTVPSNNAANPTPSTPEQSQIRIESTPNTYPTAAKDTPAEPEVVTVKSVPASKPVAKSSLGTPSAAKTQSNANAEVTAPPVFGSTPAAEPSVLSHIVQTTSVATPKMAAPQILRVSQGVTQGLLIKRVQPTYPRQAMQLHIQGSVQLQATISKEGVISGEKVLSGDPILARAAVDAVRQWRYKPYFLNGEPVDIETQITVNFKLP